MRILGISCYFHDASAALIEDGRLVAAAEEERFSRIKHDYGFPKHAIQFCLDSAGIQGKDIDYAVFFEKPFVKFERLLKTGFAAFPRSYWMFAQSMRTWLFDKLWIRSQIHSSLGLPSRRILFSDHHLSHAASAYFCSPFEKSAVLTFDGVGEWATATMGVGEGTSLTIKREMAFPHSIGLLYSAFTAFLGFEVNEGEYKVMGMAPYGEPRFVEDIWKVFHQYPDGSIWMDSRYFAFHYSTSTPYTRKFTGLFGKPRDPKTPFFTDKTGFPSYYGDKPANFAGLTRYNQHYADIAASIQRVTEEVVLTLARRAHEETGLKDLCMAGGVALNSVANGRILRETPIERLYIQPAAGDGGGSLGAALYAWHAENAGSKRFVMDHAYWGRGYGQSEAARTLTDAGLKWTEARDEDQLVAQTVDRLTKGKVVGWYQGRFEFGPRALGNRSILADPRSAEMKDIVNTKIKFREPFRPFAPSVVAAAAPQYFDLPPKSNGMPERFMLLVVPVASGKGGAVPAVNHMGTARLQTVHKETNPLYHSLISRFGEATGVPVLMNTSYNVRGEPIVNTPQDAVNTFLKSGLDTVVLGNFIVDKAT